MQKLMKTKSKETFRKRKKTWVDFQKFFNWIKDYQTTKKVWDLQYTLT